MAAPSACLVAALLATGAAAGDLPVVSREGGHATVSLPATVLDHPVVRKELTSGLTNSFFCEIVGRRPGGGKSTSRVVVRIRYEPWDEVFEVGIDATNRDSSRSTLPSLEALHGWWNELRLPLAVEPTVSRARVSVRLQFVPFSRAEQEEAQRWITSTLGSGTVLPPANATGGNPVAHPGPRLDSFLATSIRAQPVVSFSWTVPLEGGNSGDP